MVLEGHSTDFDIFFMFLKVQCMIFPFFKMFERFNPGANPSIHSISGSTNRSDRPSHPVLITNNSHPNRSISAQDVISCISYHFQLICSGQTIRNHWCRGDRQILIDDWCFWTNSLILETNGDRIMIFTNLPIPSNIRKSALFGILPGNEAVLIPEDRAATIRSPHGYAGLQLMAEVCARRPNGELTCKHTWHRLGDSA